MKRYLLLLLGIMITTIVMAADVITKKNGTTIQCKVIKVGRTEVEYKNIKNLNGPVYAIDLTEISSIKYENGGTDKFGEQSVVTTNAGQRTMTDGELMRMYNQLQKENAHPGRGWKTTGYVLGGIGIISSIIGGTTSSESEQEILRPLGPGLIILGVGSYFWGWHKQKQAKRYGFIPIFQQDFQLGNNTLLTADVNMINDNITHDKSLGMGLRFTF